jgi:uncharacterized protein
MKKRNKVLIYIFSIAAALTGLFFIWKFSIAVIIMAGIIFLPGLYVYKKSIKVYVNKYFKNILLWSIITMSFAFPLGFFGINMTAIFSKSLFFKYLLIIGQIYIVAIHFLFIISLAISLLAFLGKILKILRKETLESPKVRIPAFWFTVAFSIILLVISYRNHTETEITQYSIELPKKSSTLDSLKVVIISDLHLTLTTPDNWLKEKVEIINRLKPDIVLIPGDILDTRADLTEGKTFREDFRSIKSKYGVFASTGNHEYYGNYPENYRYILSTGMNLITDSLVLVDSSFYIVGRLDRSQKRRKNLNEVLTAKSLDLPVLLMDHQPINLKEAQDNNIDMQVSGHTHRGQLFPFNLITKYIYRLDWGFEKIGNTNFFVSSGLGLWGPPFRLGSNSEIMVVKIIFK